MYINSNLNEELFCQAMVAIKTLNKEKSQWTNNEYYRLGLKTKRILDYFSFSGLKRKFTRRKKFGSMKTPPNLPGAVNDRTVCNYFSKERIAIYTCITGKYDEVLEPLFVPDNCDFYVITDLDLPMGSIWNKIDFLKFPEVETFDNVLKNRYFKFFPHKVFPEYRYSIYIDGNIRVCSDLTEHINRISKYGVGCFKHSLRNCAYKEAKACIALKKQTPEKINQLTNYLKNNGFPLDYGLIECNFIVREHNNRECIHLMEEWWEVLIKFAHRDQISFPYILYKNGISVEEIGTLGGNVHEEYSIEFTTHNEKKGF